MTHNLEKRIPWSNRISLWVVFAMAFVAPLCWWSMRQNHLENETQQWVSESNPERAAHESTQSQFQLHDKILLTWEGSSLNDPRLAKLIEQLTGKADANGVQRGGSPYVRSVTDPHQYLDLMQKNGVDAHESVRRLEGTLLGAGSMKVRLTDIGRTGLKKSKRDLQTNFKAKFGLDLEIQDSSPDLTAMAMIPAPVKDGEPAGEPTIPAALGVDGQLLDKSSLDHDLQVSWKGMHIGSQATIAAATWMTEFTTERNGGQPIVESCFFVPGSPAGLEIELSEAGLADQSESVSALLHTCQQAGISPATVRMSGHALRESHLNKAIEKAVWDTSVPMTQLNHRSILLTSMLVCAALTIAFVRKIRLTAIVLIAGCFAVCCLLAIIPVAKSTVNQFLIVLPTVLFAWTIANALQACGAWKKAIAEKDATTCLETIHDARSMGVRSGIVAALGLITLCTVRYSPIWDLGIYGAVGSMIAMIIVAIGIPSLIQVLNVRFHKETADDHSVARFFGRLTTTYPGLQSLAAIAICLGCGYGLTQSAFETKAYREWPETAQLATEYSKMETLLAGTMTADAVIRFDQQAQKDTNFLDRMEMIRGAEEQIRKNPAISGCTSIADFHTVTQRPADDASFSQRTKYNKKASSVQQDLANGALPVAKSFYVVAGQPGEAAGVNSQVEAAGDELWRISLRVNAVSDDHLSQVLANLHHDIKGVLKMQPGSNHQIVGDLPLFVHTSENLPKNLISCCLLASTLLIVLSMISLESFSAGLMLILPCDMPFIMAFGILAMAGVKLEMEHLIAGPIAVVLVLDGKLRFLKRFQSLMKQGLSRHDAVVEAFVDRCPWMFQTTIMYVAAFAVLAQAELPMVNHFGMMLSTLVGLGLLTDLILLPQLVAGPLGRGIEVRPQVAVETPVMVAPESPPAEIPAAVATEAEAIPSPHIKPHVPPAKKRRTTNRRESDSQ